MASKNYFNSDRKKLKHIHRKLLDVTLFVIYQIYALFKVQRKFNEYQWDLSTALIPSPYLQPQEPNDRNALTKLVRSKILRSSSNIRIGPREQPLANQLADHSSRTRWEVSVDNAPPSSYRSPLHAERYLTDVGKREGPSKRSPV